MRLGIDCGGTNTKLLLTSGHGDEARASTVPTPRGDAALGRLIGAVRDFIGDDRVDAGAMSLPGVIDEGAGRLVRSANLPWFDGMALAAELTDALGGPVRLLNDGTATALAEARLGAGRGHDDVFVVALGTGVAGAHVRRGEVLRGAHGAAGEFGHVSLDDAGLPCPCGQRGCLEAVIGGGALARRWSETTGAAGTAKDLFTAAASGDARAVALVDEATTALARGLLGVVATVDPGLIVLGGGLAQSYELIAVPTAAKLRARATFHQLPELVPAALGPWAGAWGAALAAEDALAEASALLPA
jgi:glucokinase